MPRLEDINFTLNHVANLEGVSKLNGYQHADPETVKTVLEEAGRFSIDTDRVFLSGHSMGGNAAWDIGP